MRDRRMAPQDWSISNVPERQCTAHKRNGDRCKNAAIRGGAVCGWHGGRAPAVKAKARLRLEMAADRMAKELLGIATDTNVPEGVRLAAVKDALDRSGIQAKTAVSVEVSTKPYELVFDRIASGPRYETPPALEIEGEVIEDENEPEIVEADIEINAVEIEAVNDQYTDENHDVDPGPLTPGDFDYSLSGQLSGSPPGRELLSLAEANEQVADLRAREAARTRNMRRR
jgi:hypothetical protein